MTIKFKLNLSELCKADWAVEKRPHLGFQSPVWLSFSCKHILAYLCVGFGSGRLLELVSRVDWLLCVRQLATYCVDVLRGGHNDKHHEHDSFVATLWLYFWGETLENMDWFTTWFQAGSYKCDATIEEQYRRERKWFVVLDYALSLFVFGPLTVCFWRGTWTTLDIHFIAWSFALSHWTTLAIGLLGNFVFYLMSNYFDTWICRHSSVLVYALTTRVYTFLLSWFSVCHWRGVWGLLDYYTGVGWTSNAVTLSLGVGILVCLRSVRNILAPPDFILVDKPDGFFNTPTMFRQPVSYDRFTFEKYGMFYVTICFLGFSGKTNLALYCKITFPKTSKSIILSSRSG